MFAKLKALLRKAATRAKEALWTTIGNLLDAFSPEECQNYLSNCGYKFHLNRTRSHLKAPPQLDRLGGALTKLCAVPWRFMRSATGQRRTATEPVIHDRGAESARQRDVSGKPL